MDALDLVWFRCSIFHFFLVGLFIYYKKGQGVYQLDGYEPGCYIAVYLHQYGYVVYCIQEAILLTLFKVLKVLSVIQTSALFPKGKKKTLSVT